MPVKDTIEAIRNAGRGEYIRITDRDFVTTDQLKSELNELCDSHERMEQALRHYQDRENWDCGNDLCNDHSQCGNGPTVYRRGKGYDIADEALKDIEPEERGNENKVL